MKYGIISDIHGNLEALTAVLEECGRLEVQTLVCLGDIVGYGADPLECLSIIRRLNVSTVAGNHDWAVSGRLDASYFTDNGKDAITWTRSLTGMDDVTYLNALPLMLKNEDLMLAHGSPEHPEEFPYMMDVLQASDAFTAIKGHICFVGHTHFPRIFVKQSESIYEHQDVEIDLQERNTYIVNVGSVGQPRDGNPMAAFGVYDTAARTVKVHRVHYDIASAQKKIIDAGLPRRLAERLAEGR